MITCCAYGTMEPLRLWVRSMSSPGGIGEQEHIGDGQVGMTGKGTAGVRPGPGRAARAASRVLDPIDWTRRGREGLNRGMR